MATKIALKVLAIGLFGGTLDIADALIFQQPARNHPVIVLQYIASGLIGAVSFSGGLADGKTRSALDRGTPSSTMLPACLCSRGTYELVAIP